MKTDPDKKGQCDKLKLNKKLRNFEIKV